MDARYTRAVVFAACLFSLGASYGQQNRGYRTRNFIVSAPTPQLAKEIGNLAEKYRRDLAVEWLGQELPPWRDICPITASVSPQLGAGGATSFMFDRNRPFGWTMSIQGSRERVLDSVLPHEITHTIFATHFGRPLPRWADEGACTTVEHSSERGKQEKLLYNFLTTDRGIAFNRMFAMKEYPRDILPLYSQGYSLARYLIAQGGKRKFLNFVGDGMRAEDWNGAIRQHYGFDNLSDLQLTWLDWVRRGTPPIRSPRTGQPAVELASAQIATPASNAASSATAGSWYAQQRDSIQPADTGNPVRAAAISVTRPQPLGETRETVIEPSRSSLPPVPLKPSAAYQLAPVPQAGSQTFLR